MAYFAGAELFGAELIVEQTRLGRTELWIKSQFFTRKNCIWRFAWAVLQGSFIN